MSDRFWNDDVPELAVNIGELKDWLASNVQEACRQQIDELSCHVSYEDGCGGFPGSISFVVCGFEYDEKDGKGSIFSKSFDIGEEVNIWLSHYSDLKKISPTQREDLIQRRDKLNEVHKRWLATIEEQIAKPNM